MKEYELFVGTYVSGGKAESVSAWGRGKEHLLMEKLLFIIINCPFSLS